jgi:hypothetical protein
LTFGTRVGTCQREIAVIGPFWKVENNCIRHWRERWIVSHPARFVTTILTIRGSDDGLDAVTLLCISKQIKIRKCGLLKQEKNGLVRILRPRRREKAHNKQDNKDQRNARNVTHTEKSH